MALTTIPVELLTLDDGVTISTADNDAQLILVSTDADANVSPLMQFYRNSASPADNDQIGRIEIYGENDNDEKILYSEIVNQIKDASDGSEDGRMAFNVMTAGTAIARMDILPTETVFNEGSYDVDFRVESDAQSLAFFVDGGENAVGLQTNTEADGTALTSPLTISGANHGGNTLEMHRTGNSIHRQYMNTAGTSTIDIYGSSNPNLQFSIAGSAVARVNASGICFGSDTAAANALDDYEEGTYTPTMFGVTTAGSVAYSNQAGWYTKVGRIVVAYFDIAVSSASGMAGTTALTLPVQSDNINAYMGVTYWDLDDNYFDAGKGATGYVYPNTTRIELYQTTDGAKGHDVGNTFKANQTGRISGSVTYFSAT